LTGAWALHGLIRTASIGEAIQRTSQAKRVADAQIVYAGTASDQ
jgi:hypothetical protein